MSEEFDIRPTAEPLILRVEARLSAELEHYLSRKFHEQRSYFMALSDDLKTQVSALQAEDGVVVTALNDLLAKANAGGSVSDTDVQAAVDAVKGEIAKVDAAVQADDPSAEPQPAQPPAGA